MRAAGWIPSRLAGWQVPLSLIAYGLIALSIIGALGGIGYKVRESGKDVIRLEWAAANEEARRREQEASAKAAADLAAERAKRKVVIRERTTYVDKIVDRPVYATQCLDASGLSCLESAIRGQIAPGCKPDGTVPAPKPTG